MKFHDFAHFGTFWHILAHLGLILLCFEVVKIRVFMTLRVVKIEVVKGVIKLEKVVMGPEKVDFEQKLMTRVTQKLLFFEN